MCASLRFAAQVWYSHGRGGTRLSQSRRRRRHWVEPMNRIPRAPAHLLAAIAIGVCLFAGGARANDKLLDETVEFTGTVLFLQTRVPALVLGVVRNGKTAVFGFGETSDGSGKPPDR